MIFDDSKNQPEDIFEGVEPAAPSQAPPGVPAPRPVLREVAPGGAMPPARPKRGGLGKILGIFLVMILILGAGGAVFYFLYWGPAQEQIVVPVVTEEPSEIEEEETTPPAIPQEEPEEEEVLILPTEPEPELGKDTDGDGLTDEEELALGTNPNLVDTDGDGLSDREEIRVWKTNALDIDTDGDGYDDKTEIDGGYDPIGPGKLPTFPET
ncbi:hypothetical protein KJ969_01620 [Patescibacteria group bacterium]|nr:hypothetical protein [Patescibacteria group bacterium]MBU1921964.1 hypothetical protein [Patescibacteria group bacterium]